LGKREVGWSFDKPERVFKMASVGIDPDFGSLEVCRNIK
jgi:hypothetical protein